MQTTTTIPTIGKFWFKPEVEKRIRLNDGLMLQLAEVNNVRFSSVMRWFNQKDDTLMGIATLEFLKKKLGFIEVQELIEKQS